MELLRRDDHEGLARLAASEPRSLRHLQGRLWDPSPGYRRGAARALGAAAAARPEQGRDLLRRLVWALTDEAATHALHAVPAFAEIAAAAPELARPFVGPLVSTLEDPGLRAETLAALTRMAEADPSLVRPHSERIHRLADHPSDRALMARLDELLQEGEKTDD